MTNACLRATLTRDHLQANVLHAPAASGRARSRSWRRRWRSANAFGQTWPARRVRIATTSLDFGRASKQSHYGTHTTTLSPYRKPGPYLLLIISQGCVVPSQPVVELVVGNVSVREAQRAQTVLAPVGQVSAGLVKRRRELGARCRVLRLELGEDLAVGALAKDVPTLLQYGGQQWSQT